MRGDVVVLLSGGVDSTVLAARAKREGALGSTLFFDYRQPAAVQEATAAERWSRSAGVPFYRLNVDLPSAAALADGTPGPRVVAGRNLVLLALAVSFAETYGARRVWFGATLDDRALYADCRPDFVAAANQAIAAGGCGVLVEAPLAGLRRPEIADLADQLGVDLRLTWSCYSPTEEGEPCGACAACGRRMPPPRVLAGDTDGERFLRGLERCDRHPGRRG